jgi:uncharacterized protein involved in exopolysaccharide biosynthesis
MTELSEISRSSQSSLGSGWWKYLMLGLVANTLLWAIALLYIKLAPRTYTSQMVLNIPGSSSLIQVDVPGIGRTSVQNTSPYASAQDPRENYKLIVTSDAVLDAAAGQLNVSREEFGSPRIKIVDGTTVMQIEAKAKSPEAARSEVLALYNALDQRLNELREQEVVQRELSVQSTLGSAQATLETAQQRLSDYRAESGLGSVEQINQLSKNIEALRQLRAELVTQSSQTNARVEQLTNNLELSARQANDAFLLQADPLFQQTLRNYSDITANLTVLESRFTADAPTVVAERAKQQAVRESLLSQGRQLLNQSVSQNSLGSLNLNNSNSPSAREVLLQELVIAQADQQGYVAQAQEADRQIVQLENRLKTLVQLQSQADALERDLQIAQATFSSKLTQVDANRSNIYDSYPQVQTLAEASLPEKPSSPKTLLALAGAIAGSLLISSGLITHWLYRLKNRDPDKTQIYLPSGDAFDPSLKR